MELSKAGADLLGENEAGLLLALSRLTRGVSGREITRLAGVRSLTSAQRALARLVDIGIVTAEESTHATLYRLNRGHILWTPVEQILASPATIAEEIGKIVQDRAGNSVTAALFGSVARGDAARGSDIDLALILADDFPAADRESLVDELHDRVEPYTGNPLQVFDVTRSELNRMLAEDDPLVRSWANDSQTIAGTDLSTIIAEAAR